MVLADPQVPRPNLQVHPIATDTVVRPALRALDASVGPDAVRLGVALPDRCPEAVLGFRRSALADALEPKAWRLQQERRKPPRAALRTVAGEFLAQSLVLLLALDAAAQEFLLVVALVLP